MFTFNYIYNVHRGIMKTMCDQPFAVTYSPFLLFAIPNQPWKCPPQTQAP